MDDNLSFRFHHKKKRKEVGKKSRLVRRLAGTSWGGKRKILRLLHIGYSQSTMDYGLGISGTFTSNTWVKKLESSQMVGGRVISGCTKSTNNDITAREAGILPVARRAELKAGLLYERVLRLGDDNGARLVAEKQPLEEINWNGLLVKRTTWRETARALAVEAGIEHLPREKLLTAPRIPPWEEED